MRTSTKTACVTLALVLGWLEKATALPNLTIDSFTTQISDGNDVTYNVTVCNTGNTATPDSDSINVGLYLAGDSAPLCPTPGEPDLTFTILPLGSGACVPLLFEQTDTACGTHSSWVMADYACIINESSEADNSASAIVSIQGDPDPWIAHFSALSPTTAPVQYTIQVCNFGCAVSNVEIRLYHNPASAPACGALGDDLFVIATLAEQNNACVTWEPVWNNAPAGTYTSWLFIDAPCAIAETDEGNNIATFTGTVEAPPILDIAPSVLFIEVDSTTVNYTAFICNTGTGNLPATQAHFFFDQETPPNCDSTADVLAFVPELLVGDCASVTATWQDAPDGQTYTSWVMADGGCTVNEADEDNNTTSQTFTIPVIAPDLTIHWFGALPEMTDTGTYQITYFGELCNLGIEAAMFDVGLYHNNAELPLCGATPNDALTLMLDSGVCIPVDFQWLNVPPGNVTSWLVADSGCAVEEQNESNNALSTVVQVGDCLDSDNDGFFAGSDCQCNTDGIHFPCDCDDTAVIECNCCDGGDDDGDLLVDGSDPDCGSELWCPVSTTSAPSPRYAHTAVWTGEEIIIWGGIDSNGATNTGARFNPATDTWTPTTTQNAPQSRAGHTAIWTGQCMCVWGGVNDGQLYDDGACYNPVADNWISISSIGAPEPRYAHTAIWTGEEMIVWGGCADLECTIALYSGGRYDPMSGEWEEVITNWAPWPRAYHTAIWTGAKMIIWGGGTPGTGEYEQIGGVYDPLEDTWVETSRLHEPPTTMFHTAIWTDTGMIIWGGNTAYGILPYGGRYIPSP